MKGRKSTIHFGNIDKTLKPLEKGESHIIVPKWNIYSEKEESPTSALLEEIGSEFLSGGTNTIGNGAT